MPGWLAELADRVVASDPGLARLRMALSAAVGVASTLVVESGYAAVTQAGAKLGLIAMLLGAVVAMMGSTALTGTGGWRKARTAVFFPVALGVGMTTGAVLGGRTVLMLVVFVPVMFVAVFVRRFGPDYFFYGFMCWMGYFFASFLHATLPMMPFLLGAAAVATGWILLLSVTVLRTNPARTLRRTVRAFRARGRALARVCADTLEAAGAEPRQRERLRRRLNARQLRLAETALMVEAWSAEPGAIPPGGSAARLRRQLIDAQQILDRLVLATQALTSADADADLVAAAADVAERLGGRDDAAANRAAYALAEIAEQAAPAAAGGEGRDGWWPARHFAVAALEFVALARSVRERPPDPAGDAEADEFEAVVDLAMGNLPGSMATAKELPARGSHWNPIARLDLTVRQAIQASVAGGLAILAGSMLSPTRYYWAVIAAFVLFAGTATRSETFLKGVNRVLGTLVGLVASVALAELTAGHSALVLAVIVGCIFCGFYLIRVSYAYMIFFITIMLGQLYVVLHQFTEGLLVLRLEETAVGALIGFVVALVVMPLSTRDTVRAARDNLLVALADLLTAATEVLGSGPRPAERPDFDALSRAVDDRLRQLALVAKPLTRPLLVGNSPRHTRHRLTLYAALATHARELAVGLRPPLSVPAAATAGTAVACRALATTVTRLAEAGIGRPQPDAAGPLDLTDAALFAHTPVAPGTRSTDPVLRPLIHLHHLMHELALRPREPREQPPDTPATPMPAAGPAADPAPDAALSGRITTAEGAPIADGIVVLLDAAGRPTARARSGADGTYRFTGCPDGDLVAVVTAPGHKPSATRVRLTPGIPRTAGFTLAPAPYSASTIAGTVYGPAPSTPLPHTPLAVLDPAGQIVAYTSTDRDGRYHLPGLPPGEWTLLALDHPTAMAWVPLGSSQHTTLDLVCGPDDEPAQLRFPPPGR